ncbi:hypothetical protein VI817_009867 [Penicillium citrinum]|uniref:Uncharacterized protein n=1 Tax=Penicillium hetheringtonii TaxID=911720 RepID=A0AAD6DGC9_9EURO|nr:hypothetical protein N7450_006758 [Penicillium hetheringtonii]KAK5788909.1 hypothetical protein VI817_009867 [Penicillium citrinum]
MPPSKPVLHPLKTPKTMSFPSELHDSPLTATSEFIKSEEGSASSSSSITPPDSYKKFLEALTPVFSPVSAGAEYKKFNFEKRRPSPISVPSSASSDGPKTTSAIPPPSPATSKASPSPQSARLPTSLRRLRIPQTRVYSPMSDSPGSARTILSPYTPSDWKIRYIETPRSAGGKSVSVRQVVTRTVTYKRTHLEPPPKGKRRKTSESRDD